MFGIRFKKLIESDRYKNSNYTIEKANVLYRLKCNSNGEYVDLHNNGHTWSNESPYYKDCVSYFRSDIINAFNYRVPVIEPIKSLTKY